MASFAAASSLELGDDASLRFVRRAPIAIGALFAATAVWATVSLAAVAPLDDPLPAEKAEAWLLGFAIPGVALYALAAARYLALYRRRPARVLLGVVAAFALLAEAMLAIALARNWHATWWEWHLMMLAAFGLVAVSARREWREEPFSPLYLDRTAGAIRDVTVVFADLEGFTSFTERTDPARVTAMLDEYFAAGIPAVRRYGAEEEKLIGDAVMAAFNLRGDQPDHASRAVRAAVAFQEATARVADAHPAWPRFRVGVHTGDARVGVVGTAGGREYGVIGDTVNLAARLESHAKPGGIVISADTYRALPDGTAVEPLPELDVKGKEAPVDAYVLVRLPPDADERGERLQREHDEPEGKRESS